MFARKLVYGVTALAVLAFAVVGLSASAALQPAARAEEILNSIETLAARWGLKAQVFAPLRGR